MVYAFAAAHPGSYNYDGWAQVGYQQTGSAADFYGMTGIYTFSQWTKKCRTTGTCGNASDVVTDFYDTPNGSWTYSAVLNSDGFIHLHANGHHVAQTGFNVAGDWASAWQGQFFGETTETGSDQVGTASDPTSFDYIYRFDANGQANFITSLTDSTDFTDHYHRAQTTPAAGGLGQSIWTSPLTR